MDRILKTIQDLSGSAPQILVHAPFADPRNVTPFASLSSRPYDLGACVGKHVALFGTQDKVETKALFARLALTKPASLTVAWEKGMGGPTLIKMIKELGWEPYAQDSRAHSRFACFTAFPSHALLNTWAADGQPKAIPATDMKAGAGLFSYRAIDPASALLARHLPADLNGKVADFGCGWGYLTGEILKRPDVTEVSAIDDDLRAVEQTKANCPDVRVKPIWTDITRGDLPNLLDAVVMNPPFHTQGAESRRLGQLFVERAAASLKRGGVLYLVANRHLPYEATLKACFASGDTLYEGQGFKIIAARKGA